MFQCCKEDPNKDSLSKANLPKRSKLRSIALLGGLAVGPHAICLLSAGAASLGVGGVGYHLWCGEENSVADSSHGITIKRRDALPEKFTEFPRYDSDRAAALLLQAEPRFIEVIRAKQEEVGGAPIQTVFLQEPDSKVSVVFCLNGSLCPCSKPQIYEIGTLDAARLSEQFSGQRAVLEALSPLK